MYIMYSWYNQIIIIMIKLTKKSQTLAAHANLFPMFTYFLCNLQTINHYTNQETDFQLQNCPDHISVHWALPFQLFLARIFLLFGSTRCLLACCCMHAASTQIVEKLRWYHIRTCQWWRSVSRPAWSRLETGLETSFNLLVSVSSRAWKSWSRSWTHKVSVSLKAITRDHRDLKSSDLKS